MPSATRATRRDRARRGLAAGLGLLSGVVIDQHFDQRTRYGRLLSLVARSPSLLGVGIDEDTAAVITGERLLEVVGSGCVFIADGSAVVTDAPLAELGAPLLVSGAVVHTLPAGARFDLRERRLVSFEEHNPARVRHEPEEDRVSTASPDLVITETRVYRGPNVWSFEPSIHLVVDLGSLEDFPTNTLPGFVDGLLDALPGIARHSCSRGHRGGFLERLKEGTWLGHVAEHAALQLQQEAGHDIRRGKTRGTGVHGQYNIIYGYADERVGLTAGRLAVRLVNDLVRHDPEFDFGGEFEEFLLTAQRTAFGPSTQAILDEAVSRDIPWLRLNEHSLVQLGQGVHQRRIRATMTSNTSALAVDIAGDKELTTRLLAAAGLPVPRSEAVRTVAQAVRAGNRIGYPGRVQAAGRQPRPRCRAQHQERRRAAGRLPDRGGPVQARHGRRRELHHRQGLSRPHHRRPDGSAGRTGARPCHR